MVQLLQLYYCLSMELIRLKLLGLIEVSKGIETQLKEYLRDFPHARTEALDAAETFKVCINEIVMYIATTISESCKPTHNNPTHSLEICYSSEEISKICKIKAHLEDIRYHLLAPSSQKPANFEYISSILEETLELSTNTLRNIEFQGVTRGRSFEAILPSAPLSQNQVISEEELELALQNKKNQALEKQKLYKQVSYYLHEQQKKKRVSAAQSQHAHFEQIHTSLQVGFPQSKKPISLGQVALRKNKKKRFNYLQDYQQEQKRLSLQKKQVIQYLASQSHEIFKKNSPSTEEHSPEIEYSFTIENTQTFSRKNQKRDVRFKEFCIEEKLEGESLDNSIEENQKSKFGGVLEF